jgi:hypothetical protein
MLYDTVIDLDIFGKEIEEDGVKVYVGKVWIEKKKERKRKIYEKYVWRGEGYMMYKRYLRNIYKKKNGDG